MASERHLDWSGCFNVRDLGGLPAAGGRRTAWGALVRADSLHKLDASGWRALFDHGVRTVIDLRNADERESEPDRAPRPPELETIELPLDDVDDSEFWKGWADSPEFATPLYYRAHILRKPQRSADALCAIAHSPYGGVVFHCVGGRDRSGQISMLALALMGVPVAEIAADYELSAERLRPLYAQAGEEDEGTLIAAYLAELGTTFAEIIETTLSSIDAEAQMRAGGMSESDLAILRERVLEPATAKRK